jgi:SHS2 domain-containing protein
VDADDAGGARDGFIEEDHPSDAFVRVRATTLAGLFTNAALACFSLMTDLDRVRPIDERAVACEGDDREDLLAVWLNELIGVAGSQRRFFSRFEVRELTDTRLVASAWGEPVDPERHALHKEVKAATYHRLSVRETGGGWEATVLFDL